MIKLKEIYDKSGRIDFQCDYCEQDFTDYNLRLSVFLHGAVFLKGEEICYFGVTCLRCAKTVMAKGKDIVPIRQILSVFDFDFNSAFRPTDLRYHSSVNYSTNHIPNLKNLDILFNTINISSGSELKFRENLSQNYPLSKKGYVCSYIDDKVLPIGAMATLWWFNYNHVEKLLTLENENKIRVFPRYVDKMSWYEKYDFFCWRYKLYQDYLLGLKNSVSESIISLSEYAYEENINIDRLIEANSVNTNVAAFECIDNQVQQIIDRGIQATSEFLDLLVNFNPSPWDVPGTMSDFYKRVWKTISPFANNDVPSDVEELDPEKFYPIMSDVEVEELSGKIRTHYTKTHVQEWAVENHQKFIEEYISIASRPDFSYGLVWDLKCRFLRKVHDILEKGSIKESKYAMYQTGPTWTIIFNRKEITGLRQTGHKYIHYLLQHPNRTFPTKEMDGFVSSRPSREDFEEMTGKTC
jgi:hypothetical protein